MYTESTNLTFFFKTICMCVSSQNTIRLTYKIVQQLHVHALLVDTL